MFNPQQLSEQERVLVDLIENGYQLWNHINNGAARGLYSKELANAACKHLEGLAAVITSDIGAKS